MTRPFIVGIGGTTRVNSSSELALKACLMHAQALGAETRLSPPRRSTCLTTAPAGPRVTSGSTASSEALRCCDGVVLSSPAYHGAMPGMLKNALDYVEDLRNDARPYLDGRAVGVIVCANGAQAIGTTLVAVRSVIHALRGWPTPMGVGINSAAPAFDVGGTCNDPAVAAALATLAGQVVDFAEMSGNKRHRQNRTEPALV